MNCAHRLGAISHEFDLQAWLPLHPKTFFLANEPPISHPIEQTFITSLTNQRSYEKL